MTGEDIPEIHIRSKRPLMEIFTKLLCCFLRKQFFYSDALKAENQMLWVQRINAVRETATEIVNNDLIYA